MSEELKQDWWNEYVSLKKCNNATSDNENKYYSKHPGSGLRNITRVLQSHTVMRKIERMQSVTKKTTRNIAKKWNKITTNKQSKFEKL